MAATYTPIASITLGATASSVTFSSIPQTYTDLVLVVKPATTSNYYLTFNDTFNAGSTNYSWTRIYGSGSSAVSDKETSTHNLTSAWGGNGETLYITQIMNYSNTTTNKTALTRINDSIYTVLIVGLLRSTAAITSINVTDAGSGYTSGSTFNLYGIKAGNA
jgi:hypothetical protein